MRSNTRYFTAIPTAAVLVYAYMGAVNLPDRNFYPTKKEIGVMATTETMTIKNILLENNSINSDYKFISDNQIIVEQINIIHNFVSLLLRESQDLDPKYSKVVDKYFWDLG
jgi:hypothetical protein